MAKTLYTFQANLEQLEKLQKNLKDANRELEKMKKSGTASKKALQEQADGAKELNKELDQNVKKTRNVVKNTNEVTRAGKNMVNVFQSAAIAIAAAFSVRAIAGGVRGMISVFREFEATMAGVRAISGATDEEFKALEESALELGRSTIFSASQVAKLQEEFARLGFTSQQIQAAQSATIDLAAATGEDLANASATAGSVIRAFGLEAEQAGRVVDIMAGSFTNSALNLERFTQSMKFAAPVARATGFTVEETTALLMKLADAGLTGSIAGNALKNIFLELGNSSSKLSKELGGPVKGMDELVENLIKLRDGGFGASQAAELLNKRATPAFLALMNSADGLEKVALDLALADGAARQMAAIRLDTLEGDIIILQSAMEGLGIALSDTFDKTFRTVVISLTNFFQSFAENERALEIFRTAVIAAAGAVAFFASRFALIKLGSLISSVGALRTGFTGLTTALTITDRFITALSRGGFAGLATSFTRVTKGASVATLATRGFGAALRAIPFVGAIAFATSLISRFTDMGSEIDDITFKQDRLNRAFNDGIDSIRDMNEGTEERVNALKNLAKQFPALLNNIDVELLSNRELQELQDELNAQSIKTAQRRIETQKVANEQAANNAKNTINQLKSFREEVLSLGLEDVGIFSLTTQEEIDGMTQDQYYNALVTDYENFITQINSIGEKRKKVVALGMKTQD